MKKTTKKPQPPKLPQYPVDYDTKIRSGCTGCGLLNGHTQSCPYNGSPRIPTPLDNPNP